jgi:hypothetical protein
MLTERDPLYALQDRLQEPLQDPQVSAFIKK